MEELMAVMAGTQWAVESVTSQVPLSAMTSDIVQGDMQSMIAKRVKRHVAALAWKQFPGCRVTVVAIVMMMMAKGRLRT